MWKWIAEETERTGEFIDKDDYFDAMGISDENCPTSLCYCCEYAMQQNGGENVGHCKYCPLDWESKCDEYMCLYKKFPRDNKGLFERWNFATITYDIEERIKFAREIANLEVR